MMVLTGRGWLRDARHNPYSPGSPVLNVTAKIFVRGYEESS